MIKLLLSAIIVIFLCFCSTPLLASKLASNENGLNIEQGDSLQPIDSEGLTKLISKSQSELTLLNIWATWCEPCVEELPDIVKLRLEFESSDLSVIFVSADFKNNLAAVRQFLNEQKFQFVTYYKSESDNIFINALNPEWSGALPATFIYDATGRLLDFWVGKRTLEELKKVVGKYLNVTPKL